MKSVAHTRSNRVLITGASGFLGTYVLPLLQRDGFNIALLNRASSPAKQRIQSVTANLEDDLQLKRVAKHIRPSTVLHMAAKMPSGKANEDSNDELYLQQNAINTLKLAEACRHTLKHFVYISSIDVYGASTSHAIHETDPKNPQTSYGRSKLTAEQLLHWYCQRNRILLTILRPTQIYGFGEPQIKIIPTCIARALDGKPFAILGNGEDSRDFLYVKDAAQAIHLALKYPCEGTFNIGPGTSHRVSDVVREVQRNSKYALSVEHTARIKPVTHQHFSIARIRKTFGYQPRYTLRAGIAETFSQTAKAWHPVLLVDVDGPILNTVNRHYYVYAKLLQKLGAQPIPKASYWEKKRERISDFMMSGVTITERAKRKYQEDKKSMIERPSVLKLDRLQYGTLETLRRLAQQYRIIFITLRQNEENVRRELERLGVLRYAECLHVATDQKHGARAKMNAVKRCNHSSRNAILIGDTEIDHQTAKLLRIPFVAVTNGIRSSRFLQTLHPVKMISSFTQVPKILPSIHPLLR